MIFYLLNMYATIDICIIIEDPFPLMATLEPDEVHL
jgi:hypothetical protein